MVHIGTAGYSYKDWIGPFYPEGTKSTMMLDYYAMHFNFVEVNSSYYHMPSLQLFEGMRKKTPDGFKFAVKLFGGFTHERNCGKSEADQFIYSLKPFLENDRLTCILAQFPYSFHFNDANMDYLKGMREWFKDIEVNIEFRNQDWIKRESIELLKSQKLGFVCVDEPGLKGLVKKVIASTSDTAYIRMHGRNAQKWFNGEGSERYDYLYSRDELLDWVTGIRELESNSKRVVVSFNNHPIGKAIVNAGMLISMLNE